MLRSGTEIVWRDDCVFPLPSLKLPSTSMRVARTVSVRRRKSIAPTRSPKTPPCSSPSAPSRTAARYSTGIAGSRRSTSPAETTGRRARTSSVKRIPRQGLRSTTSVSTGPAEYGLQGGENRYGWSWGERSLRHSVDYLLDVCWPDAIDRQFAQHRVEVSADHDGVRARRDDPAAVVSGVQSVGGRVRVGETWCDRAAAALKTSRKLVLLYAAMLCVFQVDPSGGVLGLAWPLGPRPGQSESVPASARSAASLKLSPLPTV